MSTLEGLASYAGKLDDELYHLKEISDLKEEKVPDFQ
jgi:hypothetical protein